MTIAKVIPDVEQIKWYAQGALNGFETLDLETAAECAKGTLQSLLDYLEVFDSGGSTVEVEYKPTLTLGPLTARAAASTKEG